LSYDNILKPKLIIKDCTKKDFLLNIGAILMFAIIEMDHKL